MIGTTHIDAIEAFEKDPETKIIVMIGEIGGDAEERAADYIKANVSKPVIGYVAGFTAPEGKTMGHAGRSCRLVGHRRCQEGGARGSRRQSGQDPIGDRGAGPEGPAEPVTLDPHTPVVVGVGQAAERIDDPTTARCRRSSWRPPRRGPRWRTAAPMPPRWPPRSTPWPVCGNSRSPGRRRRF
ncbi:coA-ligase family protein [Mycobacterium xenopi 3993]|nr:coA-ligase family protein [Mycobacterium xenopi 3993]